MKIASEQRVDLAIPARQAETEPPEGWAMIRLAEVVQEVPNVKPDDQPNREFAYVDISSICNETHRILEHKRFKGKDAPSRARRPIHPGDVLFSNVRTYLRNVAIVPSSLDVQLCSTGFTVLRSNGAIDPQFLFRYVLTDDFIDRVTPQQTGTHYPATSDRVVMGEFLPIPPLAEQQRIVAKVEALLARVNAARQRLAKAPAILKRFRQWVLAAACSGRLTADWREEQTDLEAATTLLERMHAERRQSNRKAAAGRKAERGDGELPDSWAWAKVSDLLHYTRAAGYGVLQPGADLLGGVPMVRVCDIMNGTVLVEQLKRIDAKIDAQYRRTRLQGGEVLVTLVGTIGRTAVAPPAAAGANIARAVAMLPLCALVVPSYVHYALAEPSKNAELFDLAREVARKTLNLGLLKDALLPLPPFPEQHEIVRRVEALFKLADAIEKRVAAATGRAEKLTQAILAKAFRGELVPTEAELARREGRDYEPASAHLERIKRSIDLTDSTDSKRRKTRRPS